MLKSFQIRNFRLFHHLEVKKLGNVNLIVGMNNAGKSTFLEAVELYASNASPTTLQELVELRQGSWISEAKPYSPNFIDHPIRHLFFGHRLPHIGEEGILLGEVSSNSKIHISVAAYQSKYEAQGTMRVIRLSEQQFLEDLTNSELVLVSEENEKTRRLFRLDKQDIRRTSRVIYEQQNADLKYTWQFVTTDNTPNRKLAALWDLTSLTDLESEVISALQLIEPKISGIAFVEDMSKGRVNNRIPLVKIQDIDEPLPLKSTGDGINRLFQIMIALVNARNGILLVDEFENGLHWKIQPKIWDIVFRFSERLNVQVFATTHSRDCIESFEAVWQKYPSLGAFLRLEVRNSDIKVTEYTFETLTDSIETDVEVR